LPLILALPIGLGFLRVEGQRAGWFDTGMGTAMLVLLLIALLLTLIWWSLGAVRRHESVIAARDELLSTVTDHAKVGLVIVSPSHRYLYYNIAYLSVIGHANVNITGKHIEDVLGDVYRQQIRPRLEQAFTGQPVDYELEFPPQDKEQHGRTVRVQYQPQFESGRVASVIMSVTDITERKRAEDTLREADRRKDEFLATLAHELRNPLAPVMNALTLLDRCDSDEAIAADARATMWRQLKQMVRLIDDLLDVSRISRGTFELRKERVDLQSIVHQAIESVRPLCDAAGQKLTIELPAGSIWVDADPVRLHQILGNLLNNACRYSDRDTPIRLHAEQTGSDIVVSVKDIGAGIPPEKLEGIFEMFSQLDRSLERNAGGLGIGLYLVKQLVEMHGGSVTAHSEGLGRGSEFVVRLPIPFQSAEVAQPNTASSSELPVPQIERQRILVVDDNTDSALTLAALLKVYGHATQTAHDGLEAVNAAENFDPDIILLDIGLPNLNGYEACQQIRKQRRGNDMIIVALTGWGQEEDKRRAEECGFDAHLVKPVEANQLTELLASLLQRRVRTEIAIANET
jgi:PAS domain S-box-containing protein